MSTSRELRQRLEGVQASAEAARHTAHLAATHHDEALMVAREQQALRSARDRLGPELARLEVRRDELRAGASAPSAGGTTRADRPEWERIHTVGMVLGAVCAPVAEMLMTDEHHQGMHVIFFAVLFSVIGVGIALGRKGRRGRR